MRVDEKFGHHRKGYKTVECDSSIAMNLAPPNNYSYSREEDRVILRFRPEDYEDERTLVVRMSRTEAKKIGEMLVRYRNMELDHEKVLTTSNPPVTIQE